MDVLGVRPITSVGTFGRVLMWFYVAQALTGFIVGLILPWVYL